MVTEKPDSGSRRVTYITEAGTIVTVLDEATDKDGSLWYKVSLDKNNSGYVMAGFLDFYSSNAAYKQTLTEAPVDDFATVAVKIKTGRQEAAYSGPGNSYARGANGKASLDTTNNNVKAKPVQWRYAYIERAAFSDDSVLPELNFERRKCVAKQQCVMTDDPQNTKNEIARVQRGDTVIYLGRMGQWAYVEANGARGFVKLEYLNAE